MRKLHITHGSELVHRSTISVVRNMLDCDIVVSESNSSYAILLTFRLIPLG